MKEKEQSSIEICGITFEAQDVMNGVWSMGRTWMIDLFLVFVFTVSFCSNFVLFFQRKDVMNGIWVSLFLIMLFFP